MKMTKEEFINKLIDKSKQNGIILSSNQAEKMYAYKELLLEWNEKINLTAITDDEDIIVKHFIDSLLSVEYINEDERIIDVGTGAGFPGIVIAIYFDSKLNITLLDSLNKRVSFLELVIKELGLKNINVIHGRAEELANNNDYREKYDVAIARAVAPLNILLEYLSGYIKVGGRCICMKGSGAKEEEISSKNAICTLNLKMINSVKKIIENNEDIIRYFLVYKKEKETPLKYPRSYGKIKKKPL